MAVADEGSELTGEHVVMQREQVTLVELKRLGLQLGQLPHRLCRDKYGVM